MFWIWERRGSRDGMAGSGFSDYIRWKIHRDGAECWQIILRRTKTVLCKFVGSLTEDGKIEAVVVEDKIEAQAIEDGEYASRVVGKGTSNDEILDVLGMGNKGWAPMTRGLVSDTVESVADKVDHFFQLSYRVVCGSTIEKCCTAEGSEIMCMLAQKRDFPVRMWPRDYVHDGTRKDAVPKREDAW